jgi:hypothetical protein
MNFFKKADGGTGGKGEVKGLILKMPLPSALTLIPLTGWGHEK